MPTEQETHPNPLKNPSGNEISPNFKKAISRRPLCPFLYIRLSLCFFVILKREETVDDKSCCRESKKYKYKSIEQNAPPPLVFTPPSHTHPTKLSSSGKHTKRSQGKKYCSCCILWQCASTTSTSSKF